MKHALVALLALWLGASPAAAVTPESPEAAAQKQADAWLLTVDAGKYPESWDQAAALFKKALTREQWQQAVAGARGPLGKLVSRSVKSKQYTKTLPGAPDGEYVVIQYESSFENKKSAVETVTPMRDPDGVWRVSGYFIR
jgi:hypothetical protein